MLAALNVATGAPIRVMAECARSPHIIGYDHVHRYTQIGIGLGTTVSDEGTPLALQGCVFPSYTTTRDRSRIAPMRFPFLPSPSFKRMIDLNALLRFSKADEASSSEQTRVFVVDDHPAVREALASAIANTINMRLVGEGGSAQQAMRHIQRTRPDVAIVDISLEDAHGLDLVESIREEYPAVRIVVYSMYDESVYAERSIRAGASGYVMKSEPTASVISAIEAVSRGDVYLSRRMSSRILSKVIRQQDYALGSATERLTDREMTVFRMLGEGKSIRDIAATLDLSRKTVETYRRRAKEKLGFETVAELLQYAVQWTYGREQTPSESASEPANNNASSHG